MDGFSLLRMLFICVLTSKSHARYDDKEDYALTIRMPSVVSTAPDSLLCTGIKLEPEESYIVKYVPHASKTTAHHMMVFGCNEPAVHEKAWTCNAADETRSEHSVCADGEERMILFAWALDAPSKALPKGVGFRVAGTTRVKHIVIQLHYSRKFAEGETDNSGMTLHMTHNRPQQQMGYYVLGNVGFLQPQTEEVHAENACIYNDSYPIYPIGYRTHSHNLGVVTTGYRIREGKWTEIGRMSPQLPETFYPVTNPGMVIRPGDILAGRCTMNTMARSDITYMGPTNRDEMCNFYIMYSTYNQENLETKYCFSRCPEFKWTEQLTKFLPAPSDASSLDGIPNADYVRNKFNMTN